jgi:hypothetical protein
MIKKISRFLIVSAALLVGCAPDYLDVKPSKSLVVPTQLHHFQALLDAAGVAMNQGPGIQALATDEFYHPDENLKNLPFVHRNAYLWADHIFEGTGVADWEFPYKAIFNANIVLDGLRKISPDAASEKQWRHIYGSALFYRAVSHFHLAQVFAAPYEPATAATLPGIPLRLSMDVNPIAGRGTLKQTYDQIIADLTEADPMLAPQVTYINRPSGAAVKALLARIYLSIAGYEKAGQMASAALQIHDQLLDYSTLNPQAARPFPAPFSRANPEIIYHYSLTPYSALVSSPLTGVDSVLYKSYQATDLRKTCFFVSRPSGVYGFKGSYGGGASLYGGLVTDELYLIRAESYARGKKTDLALADLNTLLRSRFKKGSFTDVKATDETILDLVLEERRKELFARGLRWSDLRRLNKEPARQVVLTRIVNGKPLVLAPNDKRYVFPIPDDEIRLSGIEQNPR